MIKLSCIEGKELDLSISPKFVEHYNNQSSYAKYILDNEINNGVWYDDILAFLPEEAVIVDCGCNVGMFTLYLSSPKRTFYCVEPMPNHIEIAAELFEKFNVKAILSEGVIFNKTGKLNLLIEDSNSTMNRVGDKGIEVASSTLLDFFEQMGLEKVDFLKLDVEGAEWSIIMEDETSSAALQKCKVVFIETHPDWFSKEGEKSEQPIIDKMKSLKFIHKPGKRDNSHYFGNMR